MKIEPYLNFEGRSDEAIEFYRNALGAEVVMLMRFKDAPDPSCIPPGADEKVMHATLRFGESELMMSDASCSGGASFTGISLSIAARDKDDAKRYYDALVDGGQVQMPLAETFWSPAFGMVLDRFGVSWMVNVVA